MGFMKCPGCGSTVADNKLFCPECGAPMHLSDEIMPIGKKEDPPPARVEEPVPDERDIHRRTTRAWVIRIAVTVLLIIILVVMLMLLANSRSDSAVVGYRGLPGSECPDVPFEPVGDPVQGTNISSGASGRCSGLTPGPVFATSHFPPSIFRR